MDVQLNSLLVLVNCRKQLAAADMARNAAVANAIQSLWCTATVTVGGGGPFSMTLACRLAQLSQAQAQPQAQPHYWI